MTTPSTPGEERDRSLRRTRWALAGVAVGGAVLATGAVAVLNGGGSASATPTGPGGPGGPAAVGDGQFRPGGSVHDDRWEHDDDDDDHGGGRGLSPDQLRGLIERGRQEVEQYFGGGGQQYQQPQQQYQQPPQQQGGSAPQSRSRGS